MLTNSEIKFIKSLYLKKSRDLNSLFIVEGDKIIDELLSSDFSIENIYATKDWYDDNCPKINVQAARTDFDAKNKEFLTI